eukprot:gene36101-44520_t
MAAALALGGCGEKKTELGEGGSVVSGSAGPAGAKGADKSLTQCDAPVATLALAENPNGYTVSSSYHLPASPVPLIRLIAQQSGCFRVVDRSAGLRATVQEQELKDAGILRQKSTVAKGRGYEAQYTLIPSLTFSEQDAGRSIAGVIAMIPVLQSRFMITVNDLALAFGSGAQRAGGGGLRLRLTRPKGRGLGAARPVNLSALSQCLGGDFGVVRRHRFERIVADAAIAAAGEQHGHVRDGCHGRVIVEGFIDFDYEITQLTVRSVGADGQIATGFCDPIGHVQVSGDYVESWQPHPMHPAALEKSRQIAKAVTDNLGVGFDGKPSGLGLFGVELFVKGDQVWFSEVSPRPHDTGLVTLCTQNQSEFELHARAILGLPVDTCLRNPGASAVIYGGMDAQGIVFDGVDEALRVPGTDLRLFGKPESFAKRRMGVALARATDVETARSNAKLAASKVRPRVA